MSELAFSDFLGNWAALPWAVDYLEKKPIDATNGELIVGTFTYLIERAPDTPLRQLYPTALDSMALSELDLSVRMWNALRRRECFTFGDIASRTVAQISAWRNVGVTSVAELLRELTLTALRGDRVAGVSTASEVDETATADDDEAATSALAAMREIGEWNRLLGRANSSVLVRDPEVSDPERVAAAREKLDSVTASSLGLDSAVGIETLLDSVIGTLDERSRRVLAGRWFSDTPITLQQIADEVGVTRERVRQIEGKSQDRVRFELDRGLIADFAGAVRKRIDRVLPLENLLSTFPSLKHEVSTVAQPVWRVIDRADDAYEIVDGWCAPGSIHGAVELTRAIAIRSSQHGVLAPDSKAATFEFMGLEEDDLNRWLEHCGLTFIDGYLVTASGSTAERALALLAIAGEPLESSELLTRLGIDRSLTGLKNVLSSDDRFSRVDRDLWALSEWGLETYVSIRALIAREVETSDGPVNLVELTDRLSTAFSVSPRSILAYATSPPFSVVDGQIQLLARGEAQKSPYATRRLFRGLESWKYRTTINPDHVRGSGTPVSMGLARALRLEWQETRRFPSRKGEQTVSWTGNQPAIGSIRRFVEDDGIAIGARVFLTFGDDGRFDIQEIAEGTDVLEEVAALAGLTVGPGLIAALAVAIGLDEGSALADIIATLRKRGDLDVAELLETI